MLPRRGCFIVAGAAWDICNSGPRTVVNCYFYRSKQLKLLRLHNAVGLVFVYHYTPFLCYIVVVFLVVTFEIYLELIAMSFKYFSRGDHDVLFSCHEGSDLEGVHDAYCGSSGLWSKPLPTCWGQSKVTCIKKISVPFP